jgi:hypothetical protein
MAAGAAAVVEGAGAEAMVEVVATTVAWAAAKASIPGRTLAFWTFLNLISRGLI